MRGGDPVVPAGVAGSIDAVAAQGMDLPERDDSAGGRELTLVLGGEALPGRRIELGECPVAALRVHECPLVLRRTDQPVAVGVQQPQLTGRRFSQAPQPRQEVVGGIVQHQDPAALPAGAKQGRRQPHGGLLRPLDGAVLLVEIDRGEEDLLRREAHGLDEVVTAALVLQSFGRNDHWSAMPRVDPNLLPAVRPDDAHLVVAPLLPREGKVLGRQALARCRRVLGKHVAHLVVVG